MDKDAEYLKLKRENEGLIHISYSEFSLFNECGHKHLLEKYLKLVVQPPSIHLIFGNSIHSAIELSIKEKWNSKKRIEHFRETFIKEMMDNMKDTPEYADTENFANQGENILRILNTEKIFEKFDIIGVELPLYEPLFANYHFKGFIDLILKDKKTGKIVIIDWKTSGEEWDVSKKKKNKIFLSQMRYYKYFYSRKYNIPFDDIECKYVVLNRLLSKKCPELGYGKLQTVEIFSNESEIESSLQMLAETIRDIHIRNDFKKAKLNDNKGACYFCPHKNNPTLCNSNPKQHLDLLEQHKE